MKKKYQVFISSTFQDLKKEREAVLNAILKMNYIPSGMELFSASRVPPWEVITERIDDSDIYVLILGFNYGSLFKKGRKRISYTEKEYNYAKMKKIPIIAFIKETGALVPEEYIEHDPEKYSKLKEFKREVMSDCLCEQFQSPEDLARKVTTAVQNEINDIIQEKEKNKYARNNKKKKNDKSADKMLVGWLRPQETDKKLLWDEYFPYINKLYQQVKESENLGGFEYDGIVGISRGGLVVADLLAREQGQNVPVFSIFPYRIDNSTYYDLPGKNTIYNTHTINLLKEMNVKRVLLVDSFSRHGITILKAKEYLEKNLTLEAIRIMVVYVNKTIDDKIIEQIDYVGDIRDLQGKKLMLD